MKALVTGASGFVGRSIVAEFLSRGVEVIAVAGPNSPSTPELISADITDTSSLDSIRGVGEIDCVVHAAGLAHRFGPIDADEFSRVNVNGVENVAKLASRLGAENFILLSSVLVYGKHSSATLPITEATECKPSDSYSRSKFEGELAARRVCEENGIGLTILRPAPTIGEGSKGNFARLIRAIDKGRFVSVGRGLNRKSFVYVGDVARACAVILENAARKTEIFNVAAHAIQVRDFVSEIYAAMNRRPFPVTISPTALRNVLQLISTIMLKDRLGLTLRSLDTWVSEDVYSADLFRTTYGFEPEVNVREAIGREVAWYLKSK